MNQLLQWLSNLLKTPAELDFSNYQAWRRRFMHKRLTLGLCLGLLYFSGISTIFLIQVFTADKAFDMRVLKHLLTAVLMLLGLLWLQTPFGSRHQAIALIGLSWSVTIFTNLPNSFSSYVNADLKGWTMTFFAMATVIPFHWRWHLISHLGAYGYYFSANLLLKQPLFPSGVAATDFLFDMVWISAMPLLVVHLYERLSVAEFHTRQKLQEEQKRSERLLLNILPPGIAERLMQEQKTIADNFAEVTVLFADIVGFTQLSAAMSPTETVELLNQVFSTFDQLAEHYDLEKIKTIGDAYMVVAGIPQHRHDHACAIAEMALAMQQALKNYNEIAGYALSIRIGIHTGPVVAGVIGLKKFAYDLWGDTVNTASRMESHGLPNEIQVTRTTYECIKHLYQLEERGCITIKGKGEMTTYWLRNKRL